MSARRSRLAASLALGATSLILASGSVAAPAVNDPAHRGPVSVAVGDLNGDGRLDVVAANIGSNDVSVLLGEGDGRLRPARGYRTGRRPVSVAVGDLSGDGRLDLAVANNGSDDVSVRLGRGDGSFGPRLDYKVGDAPQSVAIGDLNGDGRPDLAVANPGSQDLSVLLGKGDGSFGPASNYQIAGIPFSLAVTDLNGDGRPDLAVVDGLGVWVLPGLGNGSFGPGRDYQTHGLPFSVTAGDLNGDGHPDLVVANNTVGSRGAPGHVSVLLANGDGSFRRRFDYGAGDGPQSAVIGDLNGDGRPDLAVANNTSNDVSVLLGRGDGSLQPAVAYGAHRSPFWLASGDLNGDGRLDLAVANIDSNDVSVLLNTGFYPLRLSVTGIAHRKCLRVPVRAHVLVTGSPSLSSVDVLLDGRRIVRTTGASFSVTLRPRRLRPGGHPLVIRARDTTGGRVEKLVRFRAGAGSRGLDHPRALDRSTWRPELCDTAPWDPERGGPADDQGDPKVGCAAQADPVHRRNGPPG